MKTAALIAIALLSAAAGAHASNAQDTGKRATEQRSAAVKSTAPIDVSSLVPRDSALKAEVDDRRTGHDIDRRGVNCSLYPIRCR